MIGIAGAVFFFGYWIIAYGNSQVRGCNTGFVELAVPGRYTGDCQQDQDASTTAAGQTVAPNGGRGLTPGGPNASGPGVRPGAVVPT